MSTVYYSGFHPETTGAKGSAAFTSSATNSATIYLYRRSATELTILDVPNGDVIYTFLTAGVDISAVSNGWSVDIPTGENPLYVVSVYVASNETTVTIESTEWTAPALLSSPGLNTATVFVYQRNNTGVAPSAISQDTTYTFSTGVLTGTYTPWTQTIQDSTEGRFLFITTALAIGEGDTATVLVASWTTPRLFSVEGVSPAVMNLSNDSITVPANSDGSSPNLTSASTIVSIFEAGEDVTSLWSITATPSTGVTGSFTGNTYSISTFTEDTGTVTFTATRAGYLNLSSVLSLAKAKAGEDGLATTVYELRVSPLVTRRDSDDVYLNNITLSAYSTTGNDAPVPFSGRFTVATSADSVNYTVQYTSSANESTYEFNKTGLPVGTNFIRLRLHVPNESPSSLNVLDEEISPVIDDGAAGPNTAIVYIYQRATSAPAAPSVAATYTFSTGITSGLNNGWSSTIPTSGTDPIWVRTAIAFSSSTTDNIESNEWSDATKLAENGLDGLNVAALFIYNRSYGYTDISSAAFLQSFSVLTQEGTVRGVFFKPDGTRVYITGSGSDAVHEYALSTPWNISTATITSTFSVAAQETLPNGVFFKPDGTIMYVVGDTGNDVNQYALSTPWSVSSASFTKTRSISTEEGTPTDLFFSPDGVNMYICGLGGDDVNQYTLSTPWDVATTTFVRNFSFASQDTAPASIFFTSDGLKMYMLGDTNNAVYAYTLSTAWNISTAVYDNVSFNVGTQDTGPSGLFIGKDGSKLYVAGFALDRIYEYDVTVSPSLPSATAEYNFVTGAITGLNNGWTSNIPEIGPAPLWVAQATANASGTTDTILSSEWSDPRIFVQNGTEGQDGPPGTAGISAYLTNEAAVVFAYANGIVVNYNGATGNFVVTSGDTNISSDFTLSTVSNLQNLTVSYTNQTYTITAGLDAAEDTASLTIRATGTGDWVGVTIDKVFTLAKTRGGYEIVSSLPTLGDPRRFEGSIVFLSTDGKLYRFVGTDWTVAVDGEDIIAGTVTAAKIGVTELSAITANVGTLTSGLIANTTSTAGNFFRLELADGRTVIRAGGSMKVSGAPFGTSNQFVEWYGPYNSGLTVAQNVAACSESTATYYLKADGSAYFGGALSAGVLRNAAQTSVTGVPAEIIIGPFGSNGNPKIVTSGYDFTWRVEISDAMAFSGTPSATIQLHRSFDGVTWTLLTSQNITGSVTGLNGFSVEEPGFIQQNISGSLTFTDTSTTLSNYRYRATLTTRTLATVTSTVISGPVITQRLSVTSTEE